MGKRFVRCLALVAFALLVTMTWVTGAGAQVTLIAACGVLATPNHTYKVTADLTACGNCLEVTADRITIDLQGHTISQGTGCGPVGAGVTDLGVARDQIIVKNGEISSGVAVGDKFLDGILLGSSTRTEVRNINSHDNFFDGIRVGNQSIIAGLPNVTPKTCRATANGGSGIFGGDRVQVQNCEASNNGFHGIEVGNRCLVTRNIADFNGHNGINAGTGDDDVPVPQAFCDVTFNTANNNGIVASDGGSGIDVEGSNSVVTGNTTNDNVDEGLSVQCPGTVTNNNSSGNGGPNYEFEGPGVCFTNNNN